MGASTFYTYGYGKNVQEAFNKEVEQSGYEDGHSYSGQIGMKNSYVVIPRSEVGRKDPQKYADYLIDKDDSRISDKWGPAGAIEILGVRLKRFRERHNLVGKRIKVYYFFGWASS